VSAQQINFELPAEVPPELAAAVVTLAGVAGFPYAFTVNRTAPGIFHYGSNRAVATNRDGSLTDASHPAIAGSVITVYLTGIGRLDNPVPTNKVESSQPLSRATLTASAAIGGMPATIEFLGLTPGTIALAQANITVPNLSAGNYSVAITIGGVVSNAPPVTVRSQ
jgi:uncharacterized protein (TIGR03437 family)